MEKITNEEFGFEIVSDEQFIDSDYAIRTVVIRLNETAMNEFNLSDANWENKILQKFGFVKNDKNSACVVKVVAEMCIVVILNEGEEDANCRR